MREWNSNSNKGDITRKDCNLGRWSVLGMGTVAL